MEIYCKECSKIVNMKWIGLSMHGKRIYECPDCKAIFIQYINGEGYTHTTEIKRRHCKECGKELLGGKSDFCKDHTTKSKRMPCKQECFTCHFDDCVVPLSLL